MADAWAATHGEMWEKLEAYEGVLAGLPAAAAAGDVPPGPWGSLGARGAARSSGPRAVCEQLGADTEGMDDEEASHLARTILETKLMLMERRIYRASAGEGATAAATATATADADADAAARSLARAAGALLRTLDGAADDAGGVESTLRAAQRALEGLQPPPSAPPHSPLCSAAPLPDAAGAASLDRLAEALEADYTTRRRILLRRAGATLRTMLDGADEKLDATAAALSRSRFSALRPAALPFGARDALCADVSVLAAQHAGAEGRGRGAAAGRAVRNMLIADVPDRGGRPGEDRNMGALSVPGARWSFRGGRGRGRGGGGGARRGEGGGERGQRGGRQGGGDQGGRRGSHRGGDGSRRGGGGGDQRGREGGEGDGAGGEAAPEGTNARAKKPRRRRKKKGAGGGAEGGGAA